MPKTVLLADNSLTIHRVVALTFANADVNITCVRDGNQAIEAIARRTPDLVLADIGMAGRNGYEVAEFVRSQPSLSAVPVLLLAGAFEPVDEAQARRVGADGVLTKPFEPGVLVSQVNQLLATGRRVATNGSEPALAPVASGAAPPASPTASESQTSPAAAAAAAGVPDAARPATAATAPHIDERPHIVMPVREVAMPHVDRPPLPVGAQESRSDDNYFDQIDQAFEALAKLPRTAPGPMLRTLDEPAKVDSEVASETPDEVRSEQMTTEPLQPRASVADRPVPPATLTDAFTALLEAERVGVVTTSVPLVTATAAAPVVDIEALAAQVARRVLEQMSDRVVRETVTEIVSSTAERLVREEIEQVKRNIP